MTLTIEAYATARAALQTTDEWPDMPALQRTLRKSGDVTSDPDEKNVFDLLADICSYALATPANTTEPYKPTAWLLSGQRTASPEDLTTEDLDFLAQIRDNLPVLPLRARTCDLLWLYRRDFHAAMDALQVWMAAPLDEDSWYYGTHDVWARALNLSMQLRQPAESHRERIISALHDALQKTQQFAFACQVSQLLRGAPARFSDDAAKLAAMETLESLATGYAGRPDRDLLEEAVRWASIAGDIDRQHDLQYKVVDSWVEQGNLSRSGNNSSSMRATHSYEQAIQALRKIPHASRSRIGITDLEDEIRSLHRASATRIQEEMSAIRIPIPGDVDALAEWTRRRVSDRSREDVLVVVGLVCPVRPFAEIHDAAADPGAGSISSFLTAVSLTPDGRKARTTTSDDEIHDVPAPVWRRMEKAIGTTMVTSVRTMLGPALAAAQTEHALREHDFAALVKESSIIPLDHRYQFTHGLWCGYMGDIVAAIHILVPQLEAFVRTQFQLYDRKTTTMDARGIENEVGLSTLVGRDDMIDVFGPDITLHFRILFEGPAGPNVRNDVAHGLVPDHAVEDSTNWFTWWFALHLVSNHVLAARTDATA